MTQIHCIGTMLGTSGYDLHFRNLVNALNKITPVRISCPLNQGWERIVNDQELEMLKRQPTKDEVTLHVTMPLHWRMNLGKRNFAYCIWEGDRVPDYFIDEMMNPRIEKILVASQHTKDAILKTLEPVTEKQEVIDKIVICPHGVDHTIFYPQDKPTDKTVFLCNKGWRNPEDRGGVQYAVKAYIEEFTDKDNVNLILKINPAYGTQGINQMIAMCSNRIENLPPITVDTNAYEYSDLLKLYNNANVFVMPTRAEAFGIPGLEAQACGLPCITTPFGGQTEYANKDNSWIVGGELTPVTWEIMYEGTKWFTPFISDIRQAMRTAQTDKELLKSKSLLSIQTAQNFGWDKTAEIIKGLI